MITAFVDAADDERAWARTLNGLVAATVEGLIREVVLIAGADDDISRRIADQSGAAIAVRDQFGAALKRARADWLLVLEGGVLLEPGWQEHVETHVQGAKQAACFTRSPHAPRPFLHHYLKAERPLALGLLIPKAQALLALNRLGDAISPVDLAVTARPRPLASSLRPKE
ncbi:MAG: hypothetical protein MUC58_08970 [Rhizobiaceae bacterium]|jgi:hypothetical protein|nr:hypothetical protein [Rhizobiaceae bacterium]